MELNDIQIKMLEEETFHLDGGNSAAGIEAASALEEAGYVTCYDSGSDYAQYTCYNYTITDKGREALKGV